jgi:hypothetical protein
VRPGHDADPSPLSSAEVKDTVELYVPLLSLRAFAAYERVKPTYLHKLFIDLFFWSKALYNIVIDFGLVS